MEELSRFDDTFLGILQHLGKIEPFLDAVFFFLARRTDFFQLMKTRDAKMGFPPGVAEKIVMTIFKKHQKMVLGDDVNSTVSVKKKKEIKESNTRSKPPTNADSQAEAAPPVAKEVEIHTQDVVTKETENRQGGDKGAVQNTAASNKCKSTARCESRWSSADSYNGAVTENYVWSQSATDVDLKVPLPSFVRKTKDIAVEVKTDSLQICLTKDPPADSTMKGRTLLEGKLHKNIRCEESLWSIVPAEYVQLNLEKQSEVWWTCALEGEAEIDKSAIDTTKDISEFDHQTQADFQRVVYDHQQKLQGKPTSQEQKTYDILKEAWDAEGSPFKGTPYDPSKVNISPNTG